jgi:ribonuclease BN (tRNA processing enzyme)
VEGIEAVASRLEIVVLGSGTSVPCPGRRPPAFAVLAGAQRLLIDCGAGASTTLAEQGIGLEQLDAVLLTHLHPDHTAELVPLLFALRNPLGPPRRQTLPVIGPPGTRAHLEALRSVYGDWIIPERCAVDVTELALAPAGVEAWRRGEVTVSAFQVAHGPRALAYRIALGERSVCFSGDSGPCEGLEAAAAGVGLLVCECGASEEEAARQPRAVQHLAASEVGQLAARAAVRRVVLTHLYPHIIEAAPIAAAREHYAGPVELAADGACLTVC